jgi:LytR cell envelope-related transcriptional attenuator
MSASASTHRPEYRSRPRFRYLKRLAGVVISLALLAAAGRIAWNYTFAQAIKPSATADACPARGAPPAPYPAPAQVDVNVMNATERRGLASTTSELLRARGFRIGRVANAPQAGLTVSAEIRYGPAGRLESRVVGAHVGGRLTFVPDDRTTTRVDVVLGAGFRQLATPQQAAALLPRLPTGC